MYLYMFFFSYFHYISLSVYIYTQMVSTWRLYFSSTLYFESHSGSYAGLSEGQGGCTDEGGCKVEEVEVAEVETHLFHAGLHPHQAMRWVGGWGSDRGRTRHARDHLCPARWPWLSAGTGWVCRAAGGDTRTQGWCTSPGTAPPAG